MIIPWTDVVMYSGMAVSVIAVVSVARGARFRQALAAAVATSLLVLCATYLHVVILTPTEIALLWFMPALVAFDVGKRAVPLSLVVLLFAFAQFVHLLLFNSWRPVEALGVAVLLLSLPFARKELPIGDRAIVAWLFYAFGLLGLIASGVALLFAAGRKNVPYAAYAAAAVAVLVFPFAGYAAHRGMLLWRF